MLIQIRQSLDDVTRRYNEQHRHYHNLDHVEDCLQKAGMYCLPWEAHVALLYHDVVYQPGSTHNEEDSISLFKEHAENLLNNDNIEWISNIILATKHTKPPRDLVEALVMDIDMSILATPWDTFVKYDDGIRKEYEQICTPRQFEIGRLNFLKKIAASSFIYHTEEFRCLWEKQARENIARMEEHYVQLVANNSSVSHE